MLYAVCCMLYAPPPEHGTPPFTAVPGTTAYLVVLLCVLLPLLHAVLNQVRQMPWLCSYLKTTLVLSVYHYQRVRAVWNDMQHHSLWPGMCCPFSIDVKSTNRHSIPVQGGIKLCPVPTLPGATVFEFHMVCFTWTLAVLFWTFWWRIAGLYTTTSTEHRRVSENPSRELFRSRRR